MPEQHAKNIINAGHITNMYVSTKADDRHPDFVYKSSTISTDDALRIINGQTHADFCAAIDENSDLTEGVYFLDSAYILRSVYKDAGRFIELKAEVNGITVRGNTSIKNWTSRSQLQNFIDAGCCPLKAYFDVSTRGGKILCVQFQVIVK